MQPLVKAILIIFLAITASCERTTTHQQTVGLVPDSPMYFQHVYPIIQQHCVVCHQKGGNAHFSLETFRDVKVNASKIAYVVQNKIMPPWPANPHYTNFIGERLLQDNEIETIVKWVKQGMAEGDESNKGTVKKVDPPSWALGKPDYEIKLPHIVLEGAGLDSFLLVKVPFEFESSVNASVIEFVPAKASSVHHVNGDMIIYDGYPKRNVFEGEHVTNMVSDSTIVLAFEKLGIPNDDGTYPLLQKSVVNYLPGVFAIRYPDGIGGFRLPQKGAFLLNDLHVGRRDSTYVDSSVIRIYLSKSPIKRPLQEFQLGTLGVSPVEPNLKIEPHTIKEVYSRYTLPETISIITINPHMHLLGKSFKAYALSPQGDTIRLIDIPRWDFNWQYFYTFKKPVKIPKGYTIVAEGVYDNTVKNPFNPNTPPKLVQDQNGSMRSVDEMFQFIISYVPYQEGDELIDLTQGN